MQQLWWTGIAVTIVYGFGRRPHFCALIDTAALLCGLENEEVARWLMDSPLTQGDGKEGCIFLARGTDLPMILLKGAAAAVPLEDASTLPEKRFCYFDQPHTTGIDINQPALGARTSGLGEKGSPDCDDSVIVGARQHVLKLGREGVCAQTLVFAKEGIKASFPPS